MIEYERIGVNCEMVLNDILKGTGWTIGYINPEFNLKYHYFEFNSQTKLSAIYEVRDKYDAICIFDTINRTVNFYKKDEYQKYKGFKIGYGKYIENIEENIDSNEIVTRLYVYGNDGLTINSVNPTGQPYIDDFSYFLYPFEMDENENIIQHSDFMSDDLAKALVKYNKFVSERSGEFYNYLMQKRDIQEEITREKNELFDLETELQIILDAISLAKQRGDSTKKLIEQRDEKNKEIKNKKDIIQRLENQVKEIDANIQDLNNILKIEYHLSEKQLEELQKFIHEEEWTDDNQYDPNDLYEAGIEQLKKINSPPIEISTSLVNFFKMIEEQHNWDRLDVGDIIRIEHDRLGIDIKISVIEISYDFDGTFIDVVVSNSKRRHTDAYEKLQDQFYTIEKVNTDYNKRKINWNKIAYNFNLRNDRIEEIPATPTNTTITHKENDNGSVNLILNWDYPDYNQTKKNEHNIDGFIIYLYSDETDEPYQFGSKMGQETIISDIPYDKRTYTIPSLPSNLYYSVGIRAYRRVDEDISLDGILMSDIAIFKPENTANNKIQTLSLFNINQNSNITLLENNDNNDDSHLSFPYQPIKEINIKGKINDIKFAASKEPPENPDLNDIWFDLNNFKTRFWNGEKWSEDKDFEKLREALKDNEELINDINEQLKNELSQVAEEVENAKNQIAEEMQRLQEEVIPEIERVVEETAIPHQVEPPIPPPSSGLWLDTSQSPPRLMRWDEEKGDYIPIALTEEEIKKLMEEMAQNAVVESKRYTKLDVIKARKEIVNRIEQEIGDVNQNIQELENMAQNLINRVNEVEEYVDTLRETIGDEIENIGQIIENVQNLSNELNQLAQELREKANGLEGRIVNIEQNIDDINGIISTTITEIERIDNTVSQHQSTIEQHSNLIASKVDNLTYQEDKQGIIESIEQNRTAIQQTAEEIKLKADKDYVDNINQIVSSHSSQLNVHADLIESKVDKTEFNELENIVNSHSSHIEQTDSLIRQTVSRVTNTENRLEIAETKIEQNAEKIALSATKEEVQIIENEVASISQNVANLTVAYDNISSEVSRIEQDLDGKIQSNTSLIQQTAQGINARIDEFRYEYDQDKTDILSSIEQNRSEINALSDQIQLRVTREEFENLQISGRNLIASSDITTNGGIIDKSKYATEGIIRFTAKAIFDGIRINAKKLKPNSKYIFSYKYRKISGTLESFGGHTDGTWSNNVVYVDGQKSDQRYHSPNSAFVADDTNIHTVEVHIITPDEIVETDYIYIQPNRGMETEVTVEIIDWQLVRGDIVPDWTPAPEDVDERIDGAIDRISQAEATLQIHAGQIEAKAERSELVNYVDKQTYTNQIGELNVAIDGISGRVSNVETNINTLTGEVQSAKSQIAELDIAVDGITTSVSNLSYDLNTAKQDITRIEQTANSIVSTVQSIQTDISNLESDMTAVQTTIAQLPDQINLAVSEGINQVIEDGDLVSKENVISSINLSTEGIKIQAPKIDIQGIVSFINSDGSTGTMIDGSRLITGSITASKLNVSSLSAISADLGTITAGTIQGIDIIGVNIRGANIEGTVLKSSDREDWLDPNFIHRAEIKSGEMEFQSKSFLGLSEMKFNGSGITLEGLDESILRYPSGYRNYGTININMGGINSNEILNLRGEHKVAIHVGSPVIVGDSLEFSYDYTDEILAGKLVARTRSPKGLYFQSPFAISGSLTVEGNIKVSKFDNPLWTGGAFLTDTQTVIPSKPLSQCMTGWILRWQAYNVGEGMVNSDYQYIHIPKVTLQAGGRGHRLVLRRGDTMVYKYVYVYDDRLVGFAGNGQGDNRNLVLSGVFEY